MTITLRASSGQMLELTVDPELAWTRCYLIAEERIYLGADILPIVRERLMAMLDRPFETVPISSSMTTLLDGEWVWVISLFENHCTLYAGRQDDRLILVWQEGDARAFAFMTLTPHERSAWRQQLKDLDKRL